MREEGGGSKLKGNRSEGASWSHNVENMKMISIGRLRMVVLSILMRQKYSFASNLYDCSINI